MSEPTTTSGRPEPAVITESDLRLILQAIDEIRLVEERMVDAYFQGSLTLLNRNGYVIGDIGTVDDQWAYSTHRFGEEVQ